MPLYQLNSPINAAQQAVTTGLGSSALAGGGGDGDSGGLLENAKWEMLGKLDQQLWNNEITEEQHARWEEVFQGFSSGASNWPPIEGGALGAAVTFVEGEK